MSIRATLEAAFWDALGPEPAPPRPQPSPRRVILPQDWTAAPPVCPGCGAPAGATVEVVQEQGLAALALRAVGQALSRTHGPGPHVRVPVLFCMRCAELIGRRMNRRFMLAALGAVLFTSAQFPIVMLQDFLRDRAERGGLWMFLFNNSRFLFVALCIAALLAISCELKHYLRKDWYFGFRIDRWDEHGRRIEVVIDDPAYAALVAPARPAGPPAFSLRR